MDAYYRSSRLEIIMIDFGMYDNSFFNVLKKSLKKKYKLEYESVNMIVSVYYCVRV